MAFGRVLSGVLVACLALPSAAGAWTVASDGTTLTVTAAVGEVNRLLVADGDPGNVLVADDGAALTGVVPAGCVAEDDGTGIVTAIQCAAPPLAHVVVRAGDGADSVTTTSARVTVDADGGTGDDVLAGDAPAETLSGGAGDDIVDGGGGDDALSGGDGADDLSGGLGTDGVDGGEGNDRLSGDDGADRLTAGGGDDTLSGGLGNDTLGAGSGDDVALGDEGDDALDGGAGADTLDGGTGTDALAGGEGDDLLDAVSGPDTLSGGDGRDRLSASPEGATLDGGPGDDDLQGADGPDRLTGGAGADALRGEGGADSLDGGADADSLEGGAGPDATSGGDGADTLSYVGAATGVTVTLDGAANDGGPGEGDAITADVETIEGGSGDDVLSGGAAPVTLLGREGDDRLTGGAGADVLSGGLGDDRLDGGPGADAISGNEDADTVTYAARRAAVTVTPDLRADDGERGEGDLVDASVETIEGGRGDDRLTGAPGREATLVGGAGDDTLFAREDDGRLDTLRCGTGTDRAHVDGLDSTDSDCENLWANGRRTRYGIAPSGRPSLLLVADPIRLDARGTGTLRLRCVKRTRRRCGGEVVLTKRGRRVAQSSFALLPGVTRSVRVRLPADMRRRFARGTLVRVIVTVRDARRQPVRLVASLPLTLR